MTKTLNQIIFFFLHQNQNIFFSNIGNQNIFLEKNLQVKWSVPYTGFLSVQCWTSFTVKINFHEYDNL